MKAKNVLFLAGALMSATVFAEYDCQTFVNDIGDWNVVTLGGFTLAKPISVDLAPTNAPDEAAQYSIRCQVIYRDNLIEYDVVSSVLTHYDGKPFIDCTIAVNYSSKSTEGFSEACRLLIPIE